VAATTVWTLNLSRVALRAGLLPLGSAVALVLLWRGLRDRRWSCLVVGGIAYGLTFYTYLAARFTPGALLLFAVYTLLWRREWFWGRGWALFFGAALLTSAPLAMYLVGHWSTTLGRAGQVSIWSPGISGGDPWGLLFRQIGRTALAPLWRGDFIPRHNIPLRPVFEPLLALAALGGLGVALLRTRKTPAHVLSLLWLAVMSLPTVLAEGAPHMLRWVGVLPVLLLLPALGLDAAVRRLTRFGARGERVARAAAALVLIVSAVLNVRAYRRHLHSEAVYYNYEAGATQLAVDVNRFLGAGWQGAGLRAAEAASQPGRTVFMAARLWENWASLRYLTPASPALHVLGANAEPTAASGDVLVVLWPFEDPGTALRYLPEGQLISVQEGARERGDLETQDRLLYVTYRSQPDVVIPANATARWERGLRLSGYTVEPLADGALQVDLYWQTEAPLEAGYTVFCHVLQNGAMVGQHDGPACQGYYGTERWRAGETVCDRHVIAVSAPWDAQTMQLVVGLYRWDTMAHLAVLEADGAPGAATSVTLPGAQRAN
ncbi:MAG: hypothetical protein GX557_13425, partial [Chloroflexi bacterium]|nr:hypothetical protein [Chloroflexota bacterium]